MSEEFPYYSRVPKEQEEHLAWRRRALEKGRKNPGVFRALCRDDLLFFINTFVYILEPRKCRVLPFNTYGYQDEVLSRLLGLYGEKDVVWEKSRDMGATLSSLALILWHWMFHRNHNVLLVSRKGALVDAGSTSRDPKALFQKIDHMIRYMPEWLRPQMDRRSNHMFNWSTDSTIDGETTTGDLAAGDRRTMIFLDEFARVQEGRDVLAATRDVTRCRLFVSTPQGPGNAFFELVRRDNIEKITTHWSIHPEKSKEAYKSKGANRWNIRSPWYDEECKRCANRYEIAQELDIDYYGSGFQFFDEQTISEHESKHSRDPSWEGFLEYDPEKCRPIRLVSLSGGPLRFWVPVEGEYWSPGPGETYCMGCDISFGSDASNTCFSIVDRASGEKVAEFASGSPDPQTSGVLAVSLCKLFSSSSDKCFLIWEANGPGNLFSKTVVENGWRRVYYRELEDRVSPEPTKSLGWWSSKTTKTRLLGEYSMALREDKFVNHSGEALQECREYLVDPDGMPWHSRARTSLDPRSGKDNHGDRVIADSLAFRGCNVVRPFSEPRSKAPPPGSLAERREERRRAKRRIPGGPRFPMLGGSVWR